MGAEYFSKYVRVLRAVCADVFRKVFELMVRAEKIYVFAPHRRQHRRAVCRRQ